LVRPCRRTKKEPQAEACGSGLVVWRINSAAPADLFRQTKRRRIRLGQIFCVDSRMNHNKVALSVNARFASAGGKLGPDEAGASRSPAESSKPLA
jgi:hypothetical protein